MSASPRRPPLPRNVRLLGWVSFCNDVASEAIYPLLPHFLLTVVRGGLDQLGHIEGVAESLSSLLKLWSGGSADRTRRHKPFLIVGYAISALARPLMGLVVSPWQVLMARIGDRFGKGVRTAPRDAVIAHSTPPDQRGRAFGFHRAMDHLGAAVGPLLATAFLALWPAGQESLALRTLFLLAIVPGVVVVALVAFGVRETEPTAAERPPRFEWSLRPFDSSFRRFLLALALFTLGNSADSFLIVRVSELGVPVTYVPLLWFGIHTIKSGGSLLTGRWIDRYGPRRFIVLGWGLYALIYLAFGAATETWQAVALFLAYGLYFPLCESAEKTLVTRLVKPEHRGLAFGWFHFVMGITLLPASVVCGELYKRYGAWPPFVLSAVLAVLGSALVASIAEPKTEA